MRNHGVKYAAWQHTMSPYYRSQKKGEWLPVHPQPDGLGWKDWCGVTVNAPADGNRPAAVVGHFETHRGRVTGRRMASVITFGVDFDNMKCRGWVEARLPVFLAASAPEQALLYGVATRLTRATKLATEELRKRVKYVLFGNRKKTKKKSSASPDQMWEKTEKVYSAITSRLWAATEAGFYATLTRLADDGANAEAGHIEQVTFQQFLVTATLGVFDRCCPMDGVTPTVLRRTVMARYDLRGTLLGYGNRGAALYSSLELPAPPVAKKARATRKKGGATA